MDLRAVIMVIGSCSLAVSIDSPCPIASTCSECLAASPKCAWCTGEMAENGARCQLQSQMSCSRVEESTMYEALATVKKKKPLRPKRPISPQRVDLALRQGASATIPFEIFTQKKTVNLKFRHPRAVVVGVESACKGFEWKRKIATCEGVTRGKVTFNVTVTMKRCLPKPKKIKVTVNGNRKQTLKIKLTSVCSCNCEKNDVVVRNSSQCNSQGDWSCGMCTCNHGYYGQHCECDPAIGPDEALSRCTAPGSDVVCSGRGECVCGQCYCRPRLANSVQRYSGMYCECDDYSCDYFGNEMCGGSKRGVCRCGACLCLQGYEGAACDNSLSDGNCISPISGKICNGLGVCLNNKCECVGGHGGDTCDGDCLTGLNNCPKLCKALKPCVECFAYNSGELTTNECQRRCGFMKRMSILVDDVVTREHGGPVFRMCMFRDDGGCFFKFSHNFNENTTNKQQIRIESKKMCPDDEK